MSELDETLAKNKNFMITKKNCPYCMNAIKLLEDKNVNFAIFDENLVGGLISEINEKYGHYTFPMIFLDGNFLGGFDDLSKWFH